MSTWVKGSVTDAGAGDNGRPAGNLRIPTLGEMLFMPAEVMGHFALGFANLLCASGLPDTANLNIPACLKRLQDWTEHVQREMERNLRRFTSEPGNYRNSEAYFRAAMMVTVLQQDCGVRYAPDSVQSKLFLKSSEGFLHGLLEGEGGTCANMPVLYAAVGRQLGYPIYLCCAKGHIFCRWASSDGRERFNIEATNQGMNCFPDDYYMQWPQRITPQEVRLGHFLRNLDPAEEVAHFMSIRGHCLQDRGHFLEAIVAYSHAHRLAPAEPHHFALLMGALCDELKEHNAGRLPKSYREWADFHSIPFPKQTRNVLVDDFPRIDKTRPAFRPVHAILASNKGASHGV